MNNALIWLNRAFLAGFLTAGLAAGFWMVIEREALIARQDNPRNVVREQQVGRGKIIDRNEVVLAQTKFENGASAGTRIYPVPAAAPVVGYYSLQYGAGGIEAIYNTTLHGDVYLTPEQRIFDDLLHRPLAGGDVRLAIDAQLQERAQQLLAGYSGAIVLLNARDGQILAIASQPTFDPNSLDEQWSKLHEDTQSPLLNRATQSLYQPGAILQAVVLGEAFNSAQVFDMSWEGTASVSIQGAAFTCAGKDAPPITNISEAFIWACPRPFQILGRTLGETNLHNGFKDFGLLVQPDFDLAGTFPDTPPATGADTLDLLSIGQGNLTVSPLQMALVAAAFANNGQIPAPYLVLAVRAPGGDWQAVLPPGNPRGTISPANAQKVRNWMALSVSHGAALPAQSERYEVYGHTGLAVAGPSHNFNSWFIGFIEPDGGDAIAVAVLLENTRDTDEAARIGGTLLEVAADQQE